MREEETKREKRRGEEGEGEGPMQEMNSQRGSGVQSLTPGLGRCASSVSASILFPEKTIALPQSAIVHLSNDVFMHRFCPPPWSGVR